MDNSSVVVVYNPYDNIPDINEPLLNWEKEMALVMSPLHDIFMGELSRLTEGLVDSGEYHAIERNCNSLESMVRLLRHGMAYNKMKLVRIPSFNYDMSADRILSVVRAPPEVLVIRSLSVVLLSRTTFVAVRIVGVFGSQELEILE